MKKVLKSAVAIILCFMLLVPASSTVFAADNSYVIEESEGTKNVSKILKIFYDFVDDLIDFLVGFINVFVPTPDWEDGKSYVSGDGFMEGMTEFIDEPAAGAQWSFGYSNASLITNPDEVVGKYFVGGSLSVSDKLATDLYDDLKVRTVAMNDGSGRGTVVISVIDGYGMASTDVRAIREAMADYCDANGIVSLNVTAMHQHSAIDTFGMNGSILKALGNGFRNLAGAAPVNGQDAEYMANLYKTVEKTVKEAVEGMTTGTLTFTQIDCNEYVKDKRPPFVLDTNFDLFRFIPADGSAETWFTTSPIHCVGNGAGGTEITGDYPYYVEKYLNENKGVNFIVALGAEQGTSQKSELNLPADAPDTAYLEAYGELIANVLIDGVAADAGKEVAPLLNVRHQEMKFTIDNQILVFAGKMGLVTNKVVKEDGQFKVVSEVGYMEIGEDLAVAMVPGELAAELAYGGFLTAETSWRNEDWTVPTMQDEVGDRQLLVFGLMNDQVGYIIPANDFMSVIYEDNKSLELVSLGDRAAGQLAEAFASLVASCK